MWGARLAGAGLTRVKAIGVFIDFETTCMGPVEWDVAHLDSQAEPFSRIQRKQSFFRSAEVWRA